MSYLHGVEIKESQKPVIIAEGDSSVIALVGTAPQGKVNEAVLITSELAGVTEFGNDIGGFTIPAALAVIFAHANAKVIVINVLANADATALLDDGAMTKDVDGNWVTGIGKATLPEAAEYSGEIIAGLKALAGVEDALGIKPNIVIAPGYSQVAAIATEVDAIAKKLNGIAVVDMVAATVQAALTARASGAYATGSNAIVLCFPRAIRYNAHEEENQPCALSAFWAAAKATRDAINGYWVSPSNFELSGVLATEVPIISSLTDPAADSSLLNAQGIVTLFRRAGTGYRIWGNWTSAFPTEKTTDVMIAPKAVRMMIRESLIDAALNFIDRTVTKVAVEMTVNTVNAFLRGLVGKGAIIEGECTWDAKLNPAASIAQGQLTYTLTVTFAPSTDKLTFNEVVDTENFNFS